MYEAVEKTPERAPETASPFGGGPALAPALDPDNAAGGAIDQAGGTGEAGNPESSELVKDALQDAMERTIAYLQHTLDEKEQALLQSTIAATGLQQQLEKTKAHTEQLKKKLTTVVKAHDVLNQKVAAIAQPDTAQGKPITEAEVAQMKEQWRVAQKSMEREHTRLRSELARAKAGWHLTTQELEAQTRARRSELAHASLQVANLEREVSEAKSATATAASASHEGRMWVRLSATAAGTAVIMLALGLWWQFAHNGTGPGTVMAATPGLISSGAPSVAVATRRPTGTGVAAVAHPDSVFQRGAFQKALGRLNNSLYGQIGATPEQILKAVRESNAQTDPGVCNFQWNNGQPALYFGGGPGNNLESSLGRCATAVDNFLRPSASKDGSQPTLASKK